jgi:hypothetical protein
MKLPTGKLALCLVADTDREGRCGGVEELLYMVISEDHPQIGSQRP